MLNLKSLLTKIIARIKKPFYLKIFGITGGFKNTDKRCLVYMKTEPFYRNLNKHTNFWEIKELVHILNSKGYIVDIIDREVNDYTPDNIYDLFIGYGSGNSGKHFYKYAKKLSKAKKVLFCAGPEPSISNLLVKERYDNFNKRNNLMVPSMRMVDIDFNKFVSLADYIFCIGEKNGFSFNSYKMHKLPTISIMPSSLETDCKRVSNKDLKHFLCFAGNGLICKGVDLMIEAFQQMPEFNLHICGPEEEGLIEAYKDILSSSPNINFYGFVDTTSKAYQDLCNKCSYTILHSAAEGCATSITTNMQSGLVPIVNYEAGLNISTSGFNISSQGDRIEMIKETVNLASTISKDEYQIKVNSTLELAKNFSKKSYTQSVSQALTIIS